MIFFKLKRLEMLSKKSTNWLNSPISISPTLIDYKIHMHPLFNRYDGFAYLRDGRKEYHVKSLRITLDFVKEYNFYYRDCALYDII